MSLTNDLVSQFVKATKDTEKPKEETTLFGEVVKGEGDDAGRYYVKIDGSDQLTPVIRTTAVENGERVAVLIKNHTAILTGNMTNPSARLGDLEELNQKVIEADKVIAGELEANVAEITELIAGKADINLANIDTANIGEAFIQMLDAKYAQIDLANIDYANIDKAFIESLDAEYANIDFTNIEIAAVKELFTQSGIINDLVVSDGKITGELVGVTIKGDLIKAGTLVADKLVVLGSNGLYYKLNISGVSDGDVDENGIAVEQTDYNSLNGSVITAKSITATQIAVDDLVAFDATIGGFKITAHSLYSGAKESVDNTTAGVYMDSDAQMSIGDASNYLKFYKDDDDVYRLDISASRVLFGSDSKSVEDAIGDVDDKFTEKIDGEGGVNENLKAVDDKVDTFTGKFSKYIRFLENDTGIVIGSGDSAITLELDNKTGIIFKKNGVQFGWWDGVDFHTGNIVVDVEERAQFGNFAYIPRSDGSLSFLKVGG